MELKELIKKVGLKKNRLILEPDIGTSIGYRFKINPENFIDYANTDIKSTCTHGLVNALSNSKRAVDCQIDKLLCSLGIGIKNRNLPQKITILKELGIVAPKIISKLIKKRNYLEHRYICPKREEVEDAVDIAALFIEATNRKLQTFQESFSIGNKNTMFFKNRKFRSIIYVSFDPDNKEFELRRYREGSLIGCININSKKKEYLVLMRIILSFEEEKRSIKEVRELIE